MSKEVSKIIIAAVGLMKQYNEGLEVEYISEMRRIPSEQSPLGILGISVKMTLYGIEKNVFLGCQQCEDMLTPIGHFVVEDLIMSIFGDDLKQLF